MNSLIPAVFGIQSTAGAVPVKNDKGNYFLYHYIFITPEIIFI